MWQPVWVVDNNINKQQTFYLLPKRYNKIQRFEQSGLLLNLIVSFFCCLLNNCNPTLDLSILRSERVMVIDTLIGRYLDNIACVRLMMHLLTKETSSFSFSVPL
jgi:hypothetical protein